MDDLFSRAVLAYKFKRGASLSPTRAAPHYESEKIKKYLILPLKKSIFLILFYSCQKKKNGNFTHFQTNFTVPKIRIKNEINPFLNRSRLGHYENSKNLKNKLLKSWFWDVQKWVIFKKTKFHFFFSRKKSWFFGFFNQNFENEKIRNKIKKTHFWLDLVSDVTKTVQNIKKTN